MCRICHNYCIATFFAVLSPPRIFRTAAVSIAVSGHNEFTPMENFQIPLSDLTRINVFVSEQRYCEFGWGYLWTSGL